MEFHVLPHNMTKEIKKIPNQFPTHKQTTPSININKITYHPLVPLVLLKAVISALLNRKMPADLSHIRALKVFGGRFFCGGNKECATVRCNSEQQG